MSSRAILVCLDFKQGIANRYQMRFDNSGAGLGWRLHHMRRATFDPATPLPAENVEHFRNIGA